MSAYGKADWLPAFIEKFKIQFLLESDGKKNLCLSDHRLLSSFSIVIEPHIWQACR